MRIFFVSSCPVLLLHVTRACTTWVAMSVHSKLCLPSLQASFKAVIYFIAFHFTLLYLFFIIVLFCFISFYFVFFCFIYLFLATESLSPSLLSHEGNQTAAAWVACAHLLLVHVASVSI